MIFRNDNLRDFVNRRNIILIPERNIILSHLNFLIHISFVYLGDLIEKMKFWSLKSVVSKRERRVGTKGCRRWSHGLFSQNGRTPRDSGDSRYKHKIEKSQPSYEKNHEPKGTLLQNKRRTGFRVV